MDSSSQLCETRHKSVLRLLLMINTEATRILLEIYKWGTADKDPSMPLYQYLLNLGYSKRFLKNHIDRDQRNQISNNVQPNDFDVSLLCLVIPLAGDKLNRLGGRSWVFSEVEDHLLSMIKELKNFRNSVIHGPFKLDTPEFLRKVELLTSLLKAILQDAHCLYNVDQKTFDLNLQKLHENISKLKNGRFEQCDITSYENHILLKQKIDLILGEGKTEIKNLYRKWTVISFFSYVVHHGIHFDVNTIYTELPFGDSGPFAQQKSFRYQDLIEHVQTSPDESDSLSYDLILIEGIAGAGKTTFLKNLISDWVSELGSATHLLGYDLLIFLECRNLLIKSLESLLTFLMPETHMKFQDNDLIRCLANLNLLILVDGLDELNSSSTRVFKEILDLRLTSDVTIICTSRPEKVKDFYSLIPDNHHVSHFQLRGVPTDLRIPFVVKYHEVMNKEGYGKQEKSTLVSILETSDVCLAEHWGLPMNLFHLTVLLEVAPDRAAEISTATELFIEFGKVIMEKLLKRLKANEQTQHYDIKDLQDRVEKVLLWLYREALNSLASDHINVLEKESLKRIHNACVSLQLPTREILSAYLVEEITWSPSTTESVFTFGHKRKQEFLAANYIIQVFLGKQLTYDVHGIINSIQNHPCFIDPSLKQGFIQQLKDFLECSQRIPPSVEMSVSQDPQSTKPAQESASISERISRIMAGGVLTISPEASPNTSSVASKINLQNLHGPSPVLPSKKQTVRQILVDFFSDNASAFHVHKFQNLFIEIAGLTHLLPTDERKKVSVEIVNLFLESGVKEKDQWLNLIGEMNCNDEILQCIVKQMPELISDYVEIRDSSVKAYAQLLGVRCPDIVAVIITNDLRKVLHLKLLLRNVANGGPSQINLDLQHSFRNSAAHNEDLDPDLRFLFQRSNIGTFCGWMSKASAVCLPKTITELYLILDVNNCQALGRYIADLVHQLISLRTFHLHVHSSVDPILLSPVPRTIKNLQLYLSNVDSSLLNWASHVARQIQLANCCVGPVDTSSREDPSEIKWVFQVEGQAELRETSREQIRYRAIRLPWCKLNAEQCEAFLHYLHTAGVLMEKPMECSSAYGIMVSSSNLEAGSHQHLRDVTHQLFNCNFNVRDDELIWQK